MKFASLDYQGKVQVAILDTEAGVFWPLSGLLRDEGDLVELISAWDSVHQRIAPSGAGIALDRATILAPISSPRRNIFCVGKNYHEHAAEFQRSGFDSSAKDGEHAPEAPVVFTKPASAIVAPGAVIPRHAQVTQQLDYEAELAVVIGKAGQGIKKADAMSHVFGYTIINDVTARDLQKLHRQWFIGKSLDGFCPMGPYIVTADEVDGQALDVRCWINDELRQNANTRQLIFDIPTLIETLSAGMTLQPGDIIATGTPAGVGIGFTPPRFLQSGDRVRIEIAGLGVLENTVGNE